MIEFDDNRQVIEADSSNFLIGTIESEASKLIDVKGKR